jgi:hypothetical protein
MFAGRARLALLTDQTGAADRKERLMGLLDKIKELLGGRKGQIKSEIDKGSDAIEKRIGDKHADKVENVAEKAKDVVDKLPD